MADASDDLRELEARIEALKEAAPTIGRRILNLAQTRIGERATDQYMRRAGGSGLQASRRSRGDNGPLRIATGRLARSLVGSRFRGKNETIRRTQRTKVGVTVEYGTRVPYAAAHEYGATMTPTPKQRSFFWARHYDADSESEKNFWKALALTDQIRIPPRPYLEPAAQDERFLIAQRAQAIVAEEINQRL
jgi:phage gpG-like protein